MDKKISFTGLVESLRYNGKEYKGSLMDENDKELYCTAADVLEDLLQTCAEWTAMYESEHDKWNRLKSTITELRDNNKDDERNREVYSVAKFLCNLIDVIERDEERKDDDSD